MKLTVAVPLAADAVPALLPLLDSTGKHGFDNAVLLWTGGDKKPTIEGDCRLVRIHPDFVVEGAMHAAPDSDWVFILHPGEKLKEGVETIRDTLSRPEHDKISYVAFEGAIRGFRRGRDLSGEHVDLGSVLVKQPLVDYYTSVGDELAAERTRKRMAEEVPQPVAFPKPSLGMTVVLPTWRLGGLDVTLGALSNQQYTDFEVILVDALHRWRAGAIAERLKALPFPVRHVPVDDDIFPVSSHSRFRNTAIRRARGKRLMFFGDYACPAPDFLERHADLPEDTIGFSTWVRTTVPHDIIECPIGLSVWDVIERAKQGENLWSTFKSEVDPLAACIKHETDNHLVPWMFPTDLGPGIRPGTQHYLGHWKGDSAPTALVREINGWDEEYDGRGDQADSDFCIRMLWRGAKIRLVNTLIRVLDMHDLSVAPLTDWSRDNRSRFLDVQAARMYRCVHGLTRGVIND